MGCGQLGLISCLFAALAVWQACAEDDAQCLKQLKESVQDPRGFFSNWNFSNTTHGYVCNFNGVSCWNGQENKVIGLKLKGAGLSGSFPSGLVLCQALQILDLSHNDFSGPIPDDVCTQLPYITSMDLSQNGFSGSIPFNFENCLFLHSLLLQHNRLSGELPGGIGILPRLITLDVSSNLLTGRIPSSYTNRSSATGNPGPPFPASVFSNNHDLCGPPLSYFCPSKSNRGLIIGLVVGGTAFAGVVLACTYLWWQLSRASKKDNALLGDDDLWAKRIKAPKSVGVFLFEEPKKALTLVDFMVATNYFDRDSFLYESSRGAFYLAGMRDGSMLEVQRLWHTKKHFQAEMDSLLGMRHKNLVPLLGYCVAGSEKLLVYKHMQRKSLWENLHKVPKEDELDLKTRLRISIGAARGLAWLHHSCNPRIIHRNISSRSIFLDENYDPKISDFGLARLLNLVDMHIDADEKLAFGELGYVPPEYLHTRVATVKGDVYSFGVVLLELVTGQTAKDVSTIGECKGNLADWVLFLESNGCAKEALDLSIEEEGYEDELTQFMRVACACVMPEPKDRPTMYEVYQMLRSIGRKFDIISDELGVYADVSTAEEPEEQVVPQACES